MLRRFLKEKAESQDDGNEACTALRSERLSAIASLIESGASVADVGTDHGYLAIFLAQSGNYTHVFASDINEQPLEKAKYNAASTGTADRIEFRLSDGLAGYVSNEVDTIVIAGMGGESIASILSAAPWCRSKKLVLQAQSKLSFLRQWLNENGFIMTGGCVVEENKKFYQIWTVTGGEAVQLEPIQLLCDPVIVSARRQDSIRYLMYLKRGEALKIRSLKCSLDGFVRPMIKEAENNLRILDNLQLSIENGRI